MEPTELLLWVWRLLPQDIYILLCGCLVYGWYISYILNADGVFPQPGNTKGGNSDDEHPGGSITACILIGLLIIVSPNDFSDADTMGMWRVVFLTYTYGWYFQREIQLVIFANCNVGLDANPLQSSRRVSIRPWRNRRNGHVERFAQEQVNTIIMTLGQWTMDNASVWTICNHFQGLPQELNASQYWRTARNRSGDYKQTKNAD